MLELEAAGDACVGGVAAGDDDMACGAHRWRAAVDLQVVAGEGKGVRAACRCCWRDEEAGRCEGEGEGVAPSRGRGCAKQEVSRQAPSAAGLVPAPLLRSINLKHARPSLLRSDDCGNRARGTARTVNTPKRRRSRKRVASPGRSHRPVRVGPAVRHCCCPLSSRQRAAQQLKNSPSPQLS